MDLQAITATEEATLERYHRLQERTIRDHGYGSTDGALGITRVYCLELAAAITTTTDKLSKSHKGSQRGLAGVLRQLDPLVVSASVLQSMLNAVAIGCDLTRTLITVGNHIRAECWAAGLLNANQRLATKIEASVRASHGSVQRRRKEAERRAERAGYRGKHWPEKDVVRVGALLVDCALNALPEVFHIEDVTSRSYIGGKPEFETVKFLQVWPTALELAEAAVEQAIQRSPVFVPMRTEPAPWRSMGTGGYWTERERFSAQLIRSVEKVTVASVRSAFKAGTMSAHVSAVNSLQAVPWRINGEVLSLVQWADDWVRQDNRFIEGLYEAPLEPIRPLSAEEWKELDKNERKHHHYLLTKRRQHSRQVVSQRVMLAQDLAKAQDLVDAERFWTPMNCDWRGRVYGIPNFNFQRNDIVRSLFTFADGVQLGDDGLYWLKIHCANTGAFDKVDKKPFAERIAWVDKNIERIKALAMDPKSHVEWWTCADKPFLFVAACLELAAALKAESSSSFLTSLPVSFDGSCSGLQHLCAMTRAQEGSLVNLTPSPSPQDVYQTVSELVQTRVTADLKAGDAGSATAAKRCLDYGIDRKLVKRNVMTFAYSSKTYGMRDQLIEDTMEKLEIKVLKGDLEHHPFGDDDNGRAAAKYLAKHTYEAIKQTVALPAEAMGFLQGCARALAHEGKPLQWMTPCGLPWANRYHRPTTEKVHLWLQDRAVVLSVATGSEPEVWKSKAVDAVAPNFVHACDAAHLLRVVNACVAEGITSIATVHDSFGCHAPYAKRFNSIIREQFVSMYEEHDVLAEALASAKRDLTDCNHHRLPSVPTYGNLDLRDILNATYAFA